MIDDDDDARGPSDTRWHFDKRVPIALIVSIFIAIGGQTIVGIWWAAGQSFKTEQLDRARIAADVRIDALERERVPNGEFRADTKARLETIKETVTEIKNLLHVPQERR